MAFDHKQVFDAMACAYRNGVMEKVMYMQGRAMEKALEESGLNLVDLLNRVDETSDETVSVFERVLEHSGPVMRIAGNDLVMRFAGWLLGVPGVQELIININKVVILKMLAKKDDAVSCRPEQSCCGSDGSLKGVG